MGTERGREALDGNPRGVVVNEGLRRRGFRGVVDVLSGAGSGRKEEGDEGGDKGVGSMVKEKGKKAQKGQQQKGQKQGTEMGQQGPQGQKRRSEEGDDHQGGDAPVSKRQAKKMRLAAKQGKTQADA